MKQVAFVVRCTPLNTLRFSEALRIAVGQILCDNRVSLYLLDFGIWNALELQPRGVGMPDISESLALLAPCKIHLYADIRSLESIPGRKLSDFVEPMERVEILDRLTKADVVINF